MKKIKEELTKCIEDTLHYDPNNAIESVVQQVFETILKYERRSFLNEADGNKGNGYYERLARSVNQYFRLKVPRDRLGEFKPVFLEVLQRQEDQMLDMAFRLYTKGLTTEDIGQLFRDTYGKTISKSQISLVTKEFKKDRDAWLSRKLESQYYFIYIDALFLPVRRSDVSQEAYYIVLGLNRQLKREVLGVYNIPTESASGWNAVFLDLKKRGLKQVLMVISDGLTGLRSVIENHFPQAKIQRCLVHKIRHILYKIRSKDETQFVSDFNQIYQKQDPSFTYEKAKKEHQCFMKNWIQKYPWLDSKMLESELKYDTAYLHFPASIHRMIYTTNWIERLNKSVKRTTKIRNSFPNPDSALTLVVASLMESQLSTYELPVTAFIPAQQRLEELFDDY